MHITRRISPPALDADAARPLDAPPRPLSLPRRPLAGTGADARPSVPRASPSARCRRRAVGPLPTLLPSSGTSSETPARRGLPERRRPPPAPGPADRRHHPPSPSWATPSGGRWGRSGLFPARLPRGPRPGGGFPARAAFERPSGLPPRPGGRVSQEKEKNVFFCERNRSSRRARADRRASDPGARARDRDAGRQGRAPRRHRRARRRRRRARPGRRRPGPPRARGQHAVVDGTLRALGWGARRRGRRARGRARGGGRG